MHNGFISCVHLTTTGPFGCKFLDLPASTASLGQAITDSPAASPGRKVLPGYEERGQMKIIIITFLRNERAASKHKHFPPFSAHRYPIDYALAPMRWIPTNAVLGLPEGICIGFIANQHTHTVWEKKVNIWSERTGTIWRTTEGDRFVAVLMRVISWTNKIAQLNDM